MALGLPQPTVASAHVQGPLQGHSSMWTLCFLQSPGVRHSGALQGHRPRWLCTPCLSQVRPLGDLCFPSSRARWPCVHVPPWSWPLSFPCVRRGHSPRRAVCLPGGLNLSCDTPGRCEPPKIPGRRWLAAGRLLRVRGKVQVSGAETEAALAFWLWLSHTCHSASEEGGSRLQPACSPLVFARVAHTPQGYQCGVGKALCLSLSLWHSQGLGCCVTLVPSERPQGV